MKRQARIRVLVVDDSLVFREILARGLSTDPLIEVVATASDPFDARDKIIEFKPDVMTCDVEMPKMNGIEFIKRLMPQYPLPVIVVSTLSESVFDAMSAGAVEFVTKPDPRSPKSVEDFILSLIEKIKIAADAKVTHEYAMQPTQIAAATQDASDRVIAIGASTGGTEAVSYLLKAFSCKMPGIVIVQHIPPIFSRMFAERLNNSTCFEVKEAANGDFVEPGRVLIAPGDKHMRLKKLGEKYKVECFEGERVNGHCPSVDVLFESVAKVAGSKAIGIILTGMGYDGAKGLLAMRRKGARTIGQDEKSSVVYGMPKAAFGMGAVEKQSALESIPSCILKMLNT